MRVGYVLKRFPRYSETFVVNEVLAHERAGLDLEIFALRTPTDTHFQDSIGRVRAPVTYIPNDNIKSPVLWSILRAAREAYGEAVDPASLLDDEPLAIRQAVELAGLLRERGISHLHAHFGTVATAVARLAADMTGITYSFTAHAKDIFHEDVDSSVLDRKIRDASAVVTVSDFNRAFLCDRHRHAEAKITRIYNGLELDRFHYAEPTVSEPRILAVGRLVEKKGFLDLLDALHLLDAAGVDFRCHIVGEGELENAIRRKLQALDLGAKVVLRGPLAQAEVISEMREACVFVAPCAIAADGNRDGLPTTILEAMALGTPCVATDVTGIPEIVREGDTGLLVPQRNDRALAGAIQRLLENPLLRVSVARRARRQIELDFDVEINSARVREVFRTPSREKQAAKVLAG